VAFSLTTLKDTLKRSLEPRAASAHARLRAMRLLADAGIPVGVMIAPVIPRITDSELEDLLAAARDAGATHAGWILLRLPLEVEPLMREWLDVHHPHSAKAVWAALEDCHKGRPYDARYHHRQRGEGAYAATLSARFDLAARRLGFEVGAQPSLNAQLFRPSSPHGQLDLWG
jgi:DNA repair photolyase